jgi:type I restriction enzyme S subunit
MSMDEFQNKYCFRLEQCLERVVDNRGKTPPLSAAGVELIEVNAIESNRKTPNFDNVRKYVSDETYSTWFRSGHPKPGDTLISTVGAIGRVAFFKESRGSIAQNIVALRPKADLLDGEFLFYYLSSEGVQHRLLNMNIGVAQPSLKVPHLLSLEVELPPLPVQRRIAGILSAYDELIENSQRRIRLLEDMARALYREWFVHFRFPGHESATFKDSELGRIPDGWEVKKLGELADQMRRCVSKGQLDEVTRYVGLEHIPRQSIALDDWEEVSELGSNKLLFKRGEVLFGKIRPYFHKVVCAPFDGVCSADTIIIRAKKPDHRALVTFCVFTEAFVAHATATSNGSKMPRTDWKVLKDYPLVLPPNDLLARFSKLSEKAIDQQQNLVKRNQTLRLTRDLLLPQLLACNQQAKRQIANSI